MKYFLAAIWALFFISCTQKETVEDPLITAEHRRIESLNVIRTKINDSIALKNSKNKFQNLAGKHQLSFSNDENLPFYGGIFFKANGGDKYEVEGSATSGKNSLKIEGKIRRVSEKHLNFEGEITQNINGKIYKRTGKTTFFDENKGNFWRLQNKINGEGFVDYIDIHFKKI